MALPTASDNPFPSILITEGTVPSTPAAGKQRVYIDSTTHAMKYVNSAGTTSNVGGTGTTVATDTIWDAAGDLAVGSGADTAAKLSKGSAGGALSIINAAVAWNSGTSFPGSVVTGDRYWRTDLAMEFYYDGTRWVSTQLLTLAFGVGEALLPFTDTSAGLGLGRAPVPYLNGGTDLYLVSAVITSYVATTNSGSHFYNITIRKRNAANTGTTLATRATSSDTVDNWTRAEVSIAAVLGGVSTYKQLDFAAVKSGTPGTIYGTATVHYRIVTT